MDLEQYIIQSVPKTVYYFPNFITEKEEQYILSKVYSAPKPKWTQLNHRRLQNWGGLPHENGMIPEPIPNWLQIWINKIIEFRVFNQNAAPNHVLVNEYLPGQGIMPHLDGPLFYPTVSTISCGSHTLLHFYPYIQNKSPGENNKKVHTLLLERRSLLVLQHDMYKLFLHGIEETKYDEINEFVDNLHMSDSNYQKGTVLKRGTRISLTIRHVPKCSKFKVLLQR